MSNTCTSEMCQTMLQMLSEGCTQREVCAELGICENTSRNWKTPGHATFEQEWADAYEMGKLLQFKWWVKKGRENVGNGREFNTQLYGLCMANMFGWRSGGSSGKFDDLDERAARIEKLLGISDE